MAWLLGGAFNAYENQLKWRARHDLQQYLGENSVLGSRTWIPGIRETWNKVMFIPAIAKGFFLGEREQDVPDVFIPEGLEGLEWSQDILRYQELKEEEVGLRVKGLEDKIFGALTLNWTRFNNGLTSEEQRQHLTYEMDKLTLPFKDRPDSGTNTRTTHGNRGSGQLSPPPTPGQAGQNPGRGVS